MYFNSFWDCKGVFQGGSLRTALTLTMKTTDVEIERSLVVEMTSINDRNPGEATKWLKRDSKTSVNFQE